MPSSAKVSFTHRIRRISHFLAVHADRIACHCAAHLAIGCGKPSGHEQRQQAIARLAVNGRQVFARATLLEGFLRRVC
jgi:hypothetical protein